MTDALYKIEDKYFEPYITKDEIDLITTKVAESINKQYTNMDKPPIIIGVLNGVFMFSVRFSKKN